MSGTPPAVQPPVRGSRLLTRRALARAITPTVVALFLLFVFYVAGSTSGYTQSVLLGIAVFAVLAISLDIAAGMTGLYSLGHSALFAVGAYLTAVIALDLRWSVLLLLPVSVVGTALLGGVVGALSLRFSGLYFAITTFVLSLITTVIINRLTITGSYAGIVGPNFPPFPDALSWMGSSLVWCGAACVGLAVFVARSLRRSPLYPILLSVRDAEPLARSSGVRIAQTKIAAFVLSSMLAGLAGWLFAFLGVVSPSQFDWTISVNILVMVIIGGMNTNVGPILGATLIGLFNAYVNIPPLAQQILFGAIFVITIVAMPTGLVGVVRLARRLLPVGKGVAKVVPAGTATPVASRDSETDAAPVYGGGRTSATNGPAVQCRDIVFRYTTGAYALQKVSLAVAPGTIHGLIGPNGSGKSTLLNIISGHLRPESGGVAINGTAFATRSASDRAGAGLRRTFQSAVLVDELSVLNTPAIGQFSRVSRPMLRGPLWLGIPGTARESRQIESNSKAALRLLGVPPRWDDRIVADTPHGVQQLLQLAIANVGQPQILMLDEPVAGLTADEVEHTASLLRELRARQVTILIVEHHTRFIFSVCDQVTVLSAGRLVTSGPPSDVRAHAAVREVYLGQ